MAGKVVLAATVAAALSVCIPAFGDVTPSDGAWTTYKVPTAGVAIDLPPSWTPAEYADYTPQPGSTLATKVPGAAQLAELASKNKLVKFFAYAKVGEPVDVLVLRLSGVQLQNHGLAGELSSAALQLGISGKGVHLARATFPAGQATTVTLKTKLLGTEFEETEYVFSHAGGTVEVTFSAPADVFATYAATFVRTVRSMRYL
jgi:hypothetical protein